MIKMALNKTTASINDLAVVHFRTLSTMSDAIRQWKRDKPVMVAESCARQVWMGAREDFADFPYQAHNKNAVHLIIGKDAYSFILNLITGNDSEKSGESNITGQFFDGWDAYAQSHANYAKRFTTLIQHIRADSAMIRSNVTSQIKHPRHELMARNLSGQKKGECALVIGHVREGDEVTPSVLITALFKVLGNNRKGRVNQITVAHPTLRGVVALEENLKDLKAKKFIQEDVIIQRIPFEALAKEIEKHQRVYTDLPMGVFPQVDEILINTWINRADHSNSFTHLRGDPTNVGNMNAMWKNAELDSFVSPEAIRIEMTRVGQENNRLKALTVAVVNYCATMRERRDTPNWHKYLQQNSTPKLLRIAS